MMNERMFFVYFFRNQSWKILFYFFLSLFLFCFVFLDCFFVIEVVIQVHQLKYFIPI